MLWINNVCYSFSWNQLEWEGLNEICYAYRKVIYLKTIKNEPGRVEVPPIGIGSGARSSGGGRVLRRRRWRQAWGAGARASRRRRQQRPRRPAPANPAPWPGPFAAIFLLQVKVDTYKCIIINKAETCGNEEIETTAQENFLTL